MPDQHRFRIPGGCTFFSVKQLERRGSTFLTDRIDSFAGCIGPYPIAFMRRITPAG